MSEISATEVVASYWDGQGSKPDENQVFYLAARYGMNESDIRQAISDLECVR